MLRSRDVLSVGSVQGLHHLDAEVVMLADEVGGNLLGGAAEEGLGEALGSHCFITKNHKKSGGALLA